MTIWFRAAISSDKKTVFSGIGGLKTAGRWHHIGNSVIYCSESIALCTLELLANQGLSISSFDYYRYKIDIDESLIVRFNENQLPLDWKETPASCNTRDFAKKHLFHSNKLAIAVPSVLVPEEYNLIINPQHPDYQKTKKSIQALGPYKTPKRQTIGHGKSRN